MRLILLCCNVNLFLFVDFCYVEQTYHPRKTEDGMSWELKVPQSSRIVVTVRFRKSSAPLTPCFVDSAAKKQHSVVFYLLPVGSTKDKKADTDLVSAFCLSLVSRG